MVLIETNVSHSLRNRVLFQDGGEIRGFGGRDSCIVDTIRVTDKMALDSGNTIQNQFRAVIGNAASQVDLADQGCGINGVIESLLQ